MAVANILIRGNRLRVNGEPALEGESYEYIMDGAPDFVQKEIMNLIDRWGTQLDSVDTVQAFACHRARLLAQKWGSRHP